MLGLTLSVRGRLSSVEARLAGAEVGVRDLRAAINLPWSGGGGGAPACAIAVARVAEASEWLFVPWRGHSVAALVYLHGSAIAPARGAYTGQRERAHECAARRGAVGTWLSVRRLPRFLYSGLVLACGVADTRDLPRVTE